MWYLLTEAEADRLNYPCDGCPREGMCESVAEQWLPVGWIPRPRTRMGWFVYHLVHGMWMRYPLHKVLGYAVVYGLIRPPIMNDL